MKLSFLDQLALAAKDLPPRQASVARYVLGHNFEATTSPMRALAKASGETPATFTRLAQSLGLSGWDELRAALTAQTREGLDHARNAPFSSRGVGIADSGLVGDMIRSDAANLSTLSSSGMAQAALVLEQAPRVLIAGFRSCFGPASLLHYLYRLFRTDVMLIGGPGGILDLELGALRPDDAVIVFGFDPYSRDSLLTAKAAASAGCRTVAIVDDAAAPIATDADVALVFGMESPGFFPSLTACVSLVQALATLLYARSGDEGRHTLQETEKRIESHNAYVADSGGKN